MHRLQNSEPIGLPPKPDSCAMLLIVSWEQIIGFTLALLIMLVGLIGSILPAMPGTPLVLAAAIAHRLYFGANSISTVVLTVLLLLTIVSILFDYAAGAIGAKKLGSTWRGMVGAIIGGIVGLFFSIPGIILGPFIGAMFLEMCGGQEFKKALKAGTGAVLGLFLGIAGKFAICVVMILLFVVNVIFFHRAG